MTPQAPAGPRWYQSAASLLPAIAALLLAAGCVLGFVFWSSNNIDQRALARQTEMAASGFTGLRNEIEYRQAMMAQWDEAVAQTQGTLDPQWLHNKLGRYMNDRLGHDRTLVVGGDGTPIYAGIAGYMTPAEDAVALVEGLAPVFARLRAAGFPPVISEFGVLEGRPALFAAAPVRVSTDAIAAGADAPPLIGSVRFLGNAAAAEFAAKYLFENARFSFSQPTAPGRAVYPLLGSNGRFVAFFEWDRDRPGRLLLQQAGPALGLAVLLTAAAIVLLLSRLKRSAAALEAGRRQAEYQALHDRLTGLPNRASFDTELARLLGDSHGQRPMWLMMLDLDRFKQVNDTLGHQTGDDLICAVSRRLRLVAGDTTFIARLGGDEFAVIASEEGIEVNALATRIIEAIDQPFYLNSFKAHVGASIGIVAAGTGGATPSEVVRKADIALYEAKANGRNRAVTYEEHMNELLQLQHTIEGELREALSSGNQLTVAFQPLVDQRTRRVIGAEALARWTHPKFGQISPARFIPIAESTGLIEALGELVLRRACELGAKQAGRTIAVNISPVQLRNARFAAQVFDILHETGMQASDLELEITESILLDDEHVSSQNLRTFRTAGIHIALDDFGTGYSSLSYLKRYPVDRIKIDRSFVSQLADGHVSVAITEAIVTLAHAMNIEVTAEGVETDEQAQILSRLGCNTLQGFLFSPAVSPERIVEIFADPSPAALPGVEAA